MVVAGKMHCPPCIFPSGRGQLSMATGTGTQQIGFAFQTFVEQFN